MFYRKPTIEYGIIGLERFGYSLASTLAQANKEILVLDNIRKFESYLGSGR